MFIIYRLVWICILERSSNS